MDNIIRVGDKIEIVRLDNLGREVGKSPKYVSQLLDIYSKDTAKIALPILNNMVVPLEVGSNYRLCFYTERGLYQCSATITDRYKESQLFIADVLFTSDLEKLQRRQYYRCQCVFDMKYRFIDPMEVKMRDLLINGKVPQDHIQEIEEKLEELTNQFLDGIAIDLSGGGMRFTSEKKYHKDDFFILKLPISNAERSQMEIRAKVISSEQHINKRTIYEQRVEFINISSRQRESIIRYIFEMERIQRKNDKN